MTMRGKLAALMVSCGMLNGCVAVVAPIVAAGALGGKQVLGRKGDSTTARDAPAAVAVAPVEAIAATPSPVAAAVPVQSVSPEPVTPIAASTSVPAPTALPKHSWRSMVTYVADAVQTKARPVDSAVLAADIDLAAPRYVPCGAKPFAVIVDAEGTVLPRMDAPDGTSVRTDDALRSFSDIRFGQVVVIFTSGRSPGEIAATEVALERAKLGPAMQGRELLSAADGPAGATKAALRTAVANQYCVLALVGDDPEDFVDVRAGEGLPATLAPRWGAGWFRIPAQVAP